MRDTRARIEALGARVVCISFGPASKASAWLAETGSPFPLLVDARREVYAAYGMRRSLRSWNVATLRRYRELLREGREWRGVQGDSLQLGGDAIVDAAGTIRLLHPSKDPTDRPSPDALLHELAALGDSGGAVGRGRKEA